MAELRNYDRFIHEYVQRENMPINKIQDGAVYQLCVQSLIKPILKGFSYGCAEITGMYRPMKLTSSTQVFIWLLFAFNLQVFKLGQYLPNLFKLFV